MAAIKNIAIVGATGHVGTFIVDALLKQGKHSITAITRGGNTGDIASGVKVQTVDYDSHASLVEGLKGNDALIITMAARAPREQQPKLIKAAAEAGVAWILPNEWGSDTLHPFMQRNPANANKVSAYKLIQDEGKNYIAFVNNQWWEWSMGLGMYGIDVQKRTVKFWDDGNAKTVTTTWPRVGEALAKLLALPLSGASPCLEDFKNQHVYVSSFYLSQREMFDIAKRNTKTTDADWHITEAPVVPDYEKGMEKLKGGDYMAIGTVIYAGNFMPDSGNDYVHTKKTLNTVFGLGEENVDEAMERAIEFSKQPRPW